MISDAESTWSPVASCVPQGSALIQVQFIVFITALDGGTELSLGKFAEEEWLVPQSAVLPSSMIWTGWRCG